MKLGIKVGLKGNSYQDLVDSKPDFCEVWFHSGKIDEYHDLFSKIKQVGCTAGLHFWGMLNNEVLPNLCYPDNSILRASIDLVKKTIDIAHQNNFWYVNVHPGGAKLARVDFECEHFFPLGRKVSFEICQKILSDTMQKLSLYAKSKNVLLLLESVPNLAIGHPWYGTAGRYKPVELFELPVYYLADVIKNTKNLFFTNDFGHTAGNFVNKNRKKIINGIFKTTKKYAEFTKLLHIGYIVPPYNGTDYHGCLYYDEFKSVKAVPNYDEMKELLKIFIDQKDIGALVEPEKDHPINFKILKQIVNGIN